MKALTVKQPWVYGILHAGKDVENRSWRTHFRGWLAIHAGAVIVRDATFPGRLVVPERDELEVSAVLGVVRLADVREKSRSRWFYRPQRGETNLAWVLEDAYSIREPIPCKGSLGLWNLSPRVTRKLKEQLPRRILREMEKQEDGLR